MHNAHVSETQKKPDRKKGFSRLQNTQHTTKIKAKTPDRNDKLSKLPYGLLYDGICHLYYYCGCTDSFFCRRSGISMYCTLHTCANKTYQMWTELNRVSSWNIFKCACYSFSLVAYIQDYRVWLSSFGGAFVRKFLKRIRQAQMRSPMETHKVLKTTNFNIFNKIKTQTFLKL